MRYCDLRRKILYRTLRLVLIPLLITLAAFLSYNNNAFLVTADKLFVEHDLYSEQYVLDGILHGANQDGHLRMGKYYRMGLDSRPEIDNLHMISHQLYSEKNTIGEYRYRTQQFGLQVHVLSFLADYLNSDVRFLQAFSALLMSLVVGFFYLGIRKEFSEYQAITFCAVLILSPWVVIFAKNLYWIEATWFLPMAITLYFGRRSFESLYGALVMGFLLFVAVLVKCLCGYEYLSTIAISTCAPLAYFMVQYRFGMKRGIQQVAICGFSFILAFSAAISLHAYSLRHVSSTPISDIFTRAMARTQSQDTQLLANDTCKAATNPDQCRKDFVIRETYTRSTLQVTFRYFVMPHFLPWIDRIIFNSNDKEQLKEAKENLTIKSLLTLLVSISFQSLLFLFSIAASIITFLLFIVYCCYLMIKRKDSLSLALFVSVLAPISWFVVAKNHSADHYQLNYVLWYLPYIPFGVLLLQNSNIPLLKKVAV
jgi:hypothetical protein